MQIKDIEKLAAMMEKYKLTWAQWKEGESEVILKKEIEEKYFPLYQNENLIPSFSQDLNGNKGLNEKADREEAADMQDTFDSIGVKGSNNKNDKLSSEDFNALIEVTSPFVGVFYSSPSPESPPYVTIGTEVKKGDVLCIVESMKIMNEITAEQDGKVIDICVKNNDIVEYGQVLYKLI